MNLKKLPHILLSSAAFVTAASISQAAFQIIHTGEAYSNSFGANIGSVDTTTFPIDSGPSSLRLNFSATFQNTAFPATGTLTPGSIDWGTDSISFDYQTTSVTRVYRFRLHLANYSNTTAVLLEFPSGSPLVADGQWHSVTFTGVNWTSQYTDLVNSNTLNPATPQPLVIAIQNLTTSGAINIDNIRVGSPSAVPEPSSFAMLAAAGAGAVAMIRRRRRD